MPGAGPAEKPGNAPQGPVPTGAAQDLGQRAWSQAFQAPRAEPFTHHTPPLQVARGQLQQDGSAAHSGQAAGDPEPAARSRLCGAHAPNSLFTSVQQPVHICTTDRTPVHAQVHAQKQPGFRPCGRGASHTGPSSHQQGLPSPSALASDLLSGHASAGGLFFLV